MNVQQPLPTHQMSRDDVEALVEAERAHQNVLLGGRASNDPKTLSGNLLLLDHYVGKAVHEWAEQADPVHALDQIRKITAIAVRCLEDHGGLDGTGQARSEVYRAVRETRSVPDFHVLDLAEGLVRLRSLVRAAEDGWRSSPDRPSANSPMGFMLDIVAHGMAVMEIHGAPRRKGSA